MKHEGGGGVLFNVRLISMILSLSYDLVCQHGLIV